MRLLRSFPAVSFALVLLSIVAVCSAQRDVGLLVIAVILAAISWYVTEGPRGRILPRWVSNILVIGVTLWVFADLVQEHRDYLGALGRYAVLLTLIKLYERRTARDYAQLFLLSLLMMLAACLQSSDLLVGITLLLYVLGGVYVLLLYQLFAGFETARLLRHASAPGDHRLLPPLKPIFGRQPEARFQFQAAGIAAAGVLVSVAVFLAFPRDVGANFLTFPGSASNQRVARFTWDIDLNAGGRINDSRVKVMSVQVNDAAGRPFRSGEPLLLRGGVAAEYTGGGRWQARNLSSAFRLVDLEPGELKTVAELPTNRTSAFTQQITLTRPIHGEAPLFSIYAPVAVATDRHMSLVHDPILQTLRTQENGRRLRSYVVKADPDAVTEAPIRAVLQEPARFASLQDLADERLRAAGVPVQRPAAEADVWRWNRRAAEAFTQWLQSGEFTYTTDLSRVVYTGPDQDPIVRFLTRTKRGHCEFFASALTALCQSKGIPARLVVGYIAYNFDESHLRYDVLESNAHAWAEVAVGERRWQPFDPTPPAALEAFHGAPSTVADQMRWAYQRFENNWTSSVVQYDGTAQAQLANTFTRTWAAQFSSALDGVRDWMSRVNQAFYFGPAGYIWMGIVATALVIAIIALIKLMRRSLAIRRTLHLQHVRGAEYQRMLRQLGFYLDMLHVLRRAGHAKPEWQPPLAHCAALAKTNRQAARIAEEITEIFYDARYGRHRLNHDELKGAQRLVQELADLLHVKA